VASYAANFTRWPIAVAVQHLGPMEYFTLAVNSEPVADPAFAITPKRTCANCAWV
jgi:hypothetical protein